MTWSLISQTECKVKDSWYEKRKKKTGGKIL